MVCLPKAGNCIHAVIMLGAFIQTRNHKLYKSKLFLVYLLHVCIIACYSRLIDLSTNVIMIK